MRRSSSNLDVSATSLLLLALVTVLCISTSLLMTPVDAHPRASPATNKCRPSSPSKRFCCNVTVRQDLVCCCKLVTGQRYDDGYEGNGNVRLFNTFQRRGWCARWGDYCVPDAKVKFADCCEGLRCVCGGLLWKPGQCQCKKPSMFG